jgi:hypothetical protein
LGVKADWREPTGRAAIATLLLEKVRTTTIRTARRAMRESPYAKPRARPYQLDAVRNLGRRGMRDEHIIRRRK